MAQIYSGIGQLLYLLGRYEESGKYLARASAVLSANGYRWGLERSEAYLALLCVRQGKKEEARQHLERARYIASRIQNPETELLIHGAEEAIAEAE
jgi:serine/threonine kinase, putative regulatory protein